MAKLTSFSDLAALLPEEERIRQEENKAQGLKIGYKGKPQTLKVALDTKQHKGKAATVISGFESTPDELEEIAKTLKKVCGTGGRTLDNAIEIHGNHCATATEKLRGMGFLVK